MSIKHPLLTCLLAFTSAGAHALSLSDAKLRSHLGEPLSVNMSVGDDLPLAPPNVRIRFGTPQETAAAGIDHSDLPDTASLTVDQDGPKLRVTITTEGMVNQPVVEFLLVVESAAARLERHYTLLLDLPY